MKMKEKVHGMIISFMCVSTAVSKIIHECLGVIIFLMGDEESCSTLMTLQFVCQLRTLNNYLSHCFLCCSLFFPQNETEEILILLLLEEAMVIH